MTRSLIAVLAVALVALFLLQASMFTVAENEQVLITQFGRIASSQQQPGLHWKTPFIQDIHTFDKRWLEWEGSANQIPTRDKKYIWVEVFARWRIADATKFYERLRDEQSAQSRLDDIIDGEVRNVVANHDVIDIVRSSGREFELGDEVDSGDEEKNAFTPTIGREEIAKLVLSKSAHVMPDYGIELADIKIMRVNYVESVQQKVFQRMISERQRIAQRYRSEGKGRSAEIEGRLERELLRIRSEAYRKAEEIRGKADAEAAAIYAEAYNRDPELYGFLKSLETYRSIIDEDTEIVLSTDAPVLKYLRAER
ncbi:MAG TPA: protease modulator HflC [Polyangiales bacterium]|nr:protease modulator HflC [Polyangiales bacterium]